MKKLHADGKSGTGSGATADQALFKGARGAAVKILMRIEQSDAYLDKMLASEMAGGDLNDMDRRLLNELATGVLRWQGKLDWILTGFYHGEFAKCLPVVRNALRVALYQILFLDKIPFSAAVNESVEIVKRLKGERSANIVNGVLRSVIRKLNEITYPEMSDDQSRYLAIMLSHPQWMVRRWLARFGPEETEALLTSNNLRPSISLRVNPLRATNQEVEAHLRGRGLAPQSSPYLPGMITVDGLGGISEDDLFRKGWYTIQDTGAALATKLAEARPGMRVIDLCAAPGGKSTAMAEAMNGEGEIIAVDKYDSKLKLIENAARRLGFEGIIHPTVGDARTIQLDPADIVLVDAPCSGLGVLSKKPDIRWKRQADDITALAKLQREILEHAVDMVKPGGHLIYTTCTIEPAENQEVVEIFLRDHPEFELVPASGVLPSTVVEDGYLQTFPHRHHMDGTFGARMRRIP
ncbi:MAG: 16S rRNA (cytosine(967)-C(5))-methyltransferase RsmB [Candidatus Kapaibacterium sp.]